MFQEFSASNSLPLRLDYFSYSYSTWSNSSYRTLINVMPACLSYPPPPVLPFRVSLSYRTSCCKAFFPPASFLSLRALYPGQSLEASSSRSSSSSCGGNSEGGGGPSFRFTRSGGGATGEEETLEVTYTSRSTAPKSRGWSLEEAAAKGGCRVEWRGVWLLFPFTFPPILSCCGQCLHASLLPCLLSLILFPPPPVCITQRRGLMIGFWILPFFLLHSVHFYKIGFQLCLYRAFLGAVILWRRRSGQTNKRSLRDKEK